MGLMGDANLCAIRGEYVSIVVKDMHLARCLRGEDALHHHEPKEEEDERD